MISLPPYIKVKEYRNEGPKKESLRIDEEKGTVMKTKKIFRGTVILLLVLFTVIPPWIFAQDQPAARKFGQEELDQMVAPIALYPDSLLAQILMAATYPLEVAVADRWAKANKNLGGDQLNDALDQKDWDPSVKALVAFPQILSMMSEKLEWTQKLGDAFLDQQDEVMDAVQKLRAKAQAAGNLTDTEEQTVIAEDGGIAIEPVQPEVIYVPVYDPFVVYGPWWYPAFPPVFFPPPPGVVIIVGRIGFWRGVTVGRTWGYAWGRWDWHHRHIYVNVNRHININRSLSTNRTNIQTTQWQHDVKHRKGVSYRSEATRERFGQSVKGAETRRDFRGFQQPIKPPKTSVVTQQGGAETKGLKTSTTTHEGYVGKKDLKGSGVTPKGLGDTKGQQVSTATRKSPVPSKERSAFGGMTQGTDARMESNRGLQSRQSMSSTGAGAANRGNLGRSR